MTRARSGVLKGCPDGVYPRWEMPAVSSDSSGMSAAEADSSKRITAVELESLQRRAYEEGFESGRRDGFARGEREGLEAATAQSQSHLERLQGILECLASPLECLDEEVERSLATLAVAIARQVVRGDLAARPDQVVMLVRETLNVLPIAARNVRLYLHPDDVSLVREALGDEVENARWIVREDATLDRGGCRVESDSSRIDASVEHRLACVIAQVLGGEPADSGLSDDA